MRGLPVLHRQVHDGAKELGSAVPREASASTCAVIVAVVLLVLVLSSLARPVDASRVAGACIRMRGNFFENEFIIRSSFVSIIIIYDYFVIPIVCRF